MSRGIYSDTLRTTLALMDALEDGRDELDDAGIVLEPIELKDSTKGSPIGTIFLDTEGHPFFKAADLWDNEIDSSSITLFEYAEATH